MDKRNLPGLKRKDIQKCIVCGEGVAGSGLPMFYRFTLEQYVLDPKAIQQLHGLETFFGGGGGGAVLANVMGPDNDLAKQLDAVGPHLICFGCIGEPFSTIMEASIEKRREAQEPLVTAGVDTQDGRIEVQIAVSSDD